ncbi:alpha/beta-hydrolase [Massarina eburnea CBS 473.64]|uniref:Alpha/beta-hydrolase n=1 Tax=Massarina eburnea CBS 473.64 TaxID=1395130 RepID=A0A6A6RIN0_9PLEO|nr:alpha/beta-hydrolase [Massarina eburnea CBS 473.64]
MDSNQSRIGYTAAVQQYIPWSWTIQSEDPQRHPCQQPLDTLLAHGITVIISGILGVIVGHSRFQERLRPERKSDNPSRKEKWCIIFHPIIKALLWVTRKIPWFIPLAVHIGACAIIAIGTKRSLGSKEAYHANFTIGEYFQLLLQLPRGGHFFLGMMMEKAREKNRRLALPCTADVENSSVEEPSKKPCPWENAFQAQVIAETLLQLIATPAMAKVVNHAMKNGLYGTSPKWAALMHVGALYYTICVVVVAVLAFLVVVPSSGLELKRQGGGSMKAKLSTSGLEKLVWRFFVLGWGLFNFVVTVFLGGIVNRRFISWPSKEEKAELSAVQERYWSLEREPLPGFKHAFLKLRTGVKLHYISNADEVTEAKNVAVFIHGFPDSFLLWHNLLTSNSLKDYILIAVDLPGYGGSDALPKYGANEVLDTLTDFILAMRTRFLKEEAKMVVVSHDWGGLIAARLASEANQLADRFVIASACIPQHATSNAFAKLNPAKQMLHTYVQRPWKNFSLLKNAYRTLTPVLSQIGRSFYIFCFNLPYPLSTFWATFGNYWLLFATNKCQAGLLKPNGTWKREPTTSEVATFRAMSSGPGIAQFEAAHGKYPDAVRKRIGDFGMSEKIRVYREGLFLGTWEKSLETVVALSEIPVSEARSGSGSGGNLFGNGPVGALRAPTTVVFGEHDVGFEKRIALDGIDDYLPKRSQVLYLYGAGHWIPHEDCWNILESVVEWAMGDEALPLKQRFGGVKGVKSLVEQ